MYTVRYRETTSDPILFVQNNYGDDERSICLIIDIKYHEIAIKSIDFLPLSEFKKRLCHT